MGRKAQHLGKPFNQINTIIQSRLVIAHRLLEPMHQSAPAAAQLGQVPALTRCGDTTRCGKIYGRHSKSLDVEKKCCGVCRSLLMFLGRFNQDGTPAKVSLATIQV